MASVYPPIIGKIRSKGLPANTGDTWVTSMTNMIQKCLFYYQGLKLFQDKIKNELDECDGPNPKHYDKLFVTILDVIVKREWQVVQHMEAITFQLASYANNEAQMNQVMDSWVIFLRYETSKFISSTIFQVIPFEIKPRSTDSYKKFIYRRVPVKTDELNDMTKKYPLRLKHQVNIQIPKQTAEECIVVFLDICSANIADHIIDADIYNEAFEYFVDEVEIIIHVLDNKDAPIEEVCAESEEEEKTEEVEDSSEGSDKDLYIGSTNCVQCKKTYAGNGLLTWWIGQNS